MACVYVFFTVTVCIAVTWEGVGVQSYVEGRKHGPANHRRGVVTHKVCSPTARRFKSAQTHRTPFSS